MTWGYPYLLSMTCSGLVQAFRDPYERATPVGGALGAFL